MMTAVSLIAGAVALGVLCLVLRPAVRTYLQFRGTRVVTCPETGKPVAVEVDARHAAATAGHGKPALRLQDCSRWPERQGCGQECLRQVESAPEACLVRTILTEWYAGKSCALCGKPFGEIVWAIHKPGLMDRARRTLAWDEVRPESLPELLPTLLPVCWDCHLAESFRRQFPELVVERPRKSA
jgi:hypothetical protein